MHCGLKWPSTGLAIALGLGTMAAAHAAPDDATLNQCWGEVTSQFVPLGDHASSPPGDSEPPFDNDGEEGRSGVGNVSKDHGDLSAGGQGIHANAVAPADIPECDGAPAGPPP